MRATWLTPSKKGMPHGPTDRCEISQDCRICRYTREKRRPWQGTTLRYTVLRFSYDDDDDDDGYQSNILFAHRGMGMHSWTFSMVLTQLTSLSKPNPKPPWGAVPNFLRSRYHAYSSPNVSKPRVVMRERSGSSLSSQRSARQFADMWNQVIETSNCAPIVVRSHIERLQ